MKKEWVTSVRDQCRREGVPFFFKQWGGVRKSAAGRKLDGKTYDEFPERTRHLVLSADECRFLASRIEFAFMRTNFIEISSPNISHDPVVENADAAWDIEIARRLEDLNSGKVKPVSLQEARIQLSRYLH